MYPSVEQLKQILLKENYISEEDSQAAEAVAQDSAGFIEFLFRKEVLSKALLGQALAESYGIPFVDLATNPLTKEGISAIPEDVARSNRSLFVRASDQVAVVVSDDPKNVDVEKLKPYFDGKKIGVAYTLPEYIESGFSLYEKPLETRFSEIIKTGERVAPEIVDEIIRDALKYHASDIHFEPQVSEVTVRFRVDGALRAAGVLPKEYYDNILNRIKVESGMRIDEHMSAQDGALQRKGDGFSTDLRVSLVPTIQGEKVVMRVLSSYVQGISLSDVGFDEAQRDLVETYAHKPFGMILTVGPTGSGKTTTLYALLKLLHQPDVNITTIEDPVEYKVGGINQIQVREQTNLTFARGLRAIVRQDPDIILVGEIRDQETAEIAVNAALTGHLLLSTFHANDAATAIPRLIDMGIEPFLLASTLELVMSQRLVRKICSHCRYSLPAETAVRELKIKSLSSFFAKGDNVYAGKGCDVCNNTGYSGRTSLFEFIEVTPEMEALILKRSSAHEIAALAKKEGSSTMFADGINKVKNGITTLAEVIRVVEPPTGS